MNTRYENTHRAYLLVTACKNEGDNLPDLIQCVLAQTIRPSQWIIVDDGSTDNTPELISDVEKKHTWIKSLRLVAHDRDIGFHLSNVVKMGFDFATDYSEKNGIDYSYLGNLDGDQNIEATFFENLIAELEKDEKIGIASGSFRYIRDGNVVDINYGQNEPAGSAMVIRRKCFENCGGIHIAWSWDSMLKAKAKISGWEARRFNHVKVTEARDFGEAEGNWRRYKLMGQAGYYFNLNPIHILIKSILLSRRKPHYSGLAYFTGYVSDALKRAKKVEDVEVREFYWNKWKKYLN